MDPLAIHAVMIDTHMGHALCVRSLKTYTRHFLPLPLVCATTHASLALACAAVWCRPSVPTAIATAVPTGAAAAHLERSVPQARSLCGRVDVPGMLRG